MPSIFLPKTLIIRNTAKWQRLARAQLLPVKADGLQVCSMAANWVGCQTFPQANSSAPFSVTPSVSRWGSSSSAQEPFHLTALPRLGSAAACPRAYQEKAIHAMRFKPFAATVAASQKVAALSQGLLITSAGLTDLPHQSSFMSPFSNKPCHCCVDVYPVLPILQCSGSSHNPGFHMHPLSKETLHCPLTAHL